MSEMSRAARRAMRAKAHRLSQETTGRVDASDYGPEENMHADVKTGMRPVSRRAYKAGGKVEGADAKQNAGKSPRTARATGGKAIVNDYVNRNDKSANDEREGYKHTGGLKTGGRAKRADGGNAGDMVPTGLLPSTNASSRMTKAAGLKDGGPAPKPTPKPTPTGTNGINIPKGGYNDPYEPTPPAPRKSGGRASFEGTARDKREDKMLAAKHHETFKEWEASAADRKHDKQRSMKGLKLGGYVDASENPKGGRTARKLGGYVDDGTRPVGGREARKSGGWIKDAIKHPGALHRELGVPEGKKIPKSKLEKAEHSDNPKLAKRARLAETLKRMHKASGGRSDDYVPGGTSKNIAEEKARRESDTRPHIKKNGLFVPSGPRKARKDGGRAKGKTNITIVVGSGQQPGSPQMQPPGGMSAAPIPVGPPPLGATGAPIPGTPGPMPGAPPPAMLPPGGAPPMGRKSGGRTVHMTAGAGSGEGRLEKTALEKRKN